jgi:hypothetical protein
MEALDYGFLPRPQEAERIDRGVVRQGKKPLGGPRLWAAAALCAALLSLFGYVGYTRHQLRSALREDTNRFVESLFERSVFETAERSAQYVWNGANGSWFDETGFSKQLMDGPDTD